MKEVNMIEKNKIYLKNMNDTHIYQAAKYLDDNGIRNNSEKYYTLVNNKEYPLKNLFEAARNYVENIDTQTFTDTEFIPNIAIEILKELGFNTVEKIMDIEKNNKIPLKFLLNLTDVEMDNSRVSLSIRPNQPKTWLSLWLDDKTCLNQLYYSPENKRNYKIGQMVFGFLQMPEYDKWLLVNVSIITDNPDADGFHKFKTIERYEPLFGRLIIDLHKGNTYQVYVFKMSTYLDRAYIHEILPVEYGSKPFPGFTNLDIGFNDLRRLIDLSGWKSALSSVSGVYLLSDISNGKRYVGSAYGMNGIYGRWKQYLEKGYDSSEEQSGTRFPNSQLKQIATDPSKGMKYIEKNFRFAVLETLPKGYINSLIIERENYWKEILTTRDANYGYNSN
jgi:hypothetical protein